MRGIIRTGLAAAMSVAAVSVAAVVVAGLGVAVVPAAAVEPGGGVEDIAAVSSDVDDFSFASLDVEYTLTRAEDGTSRMRVVETFVAVFPETDQNRGMRRLIPNSYLGAPLFPSLVSVTDGVGGERPVETEDEDDFLVVTSRADDYVHGPQTYVFTYDLQNVTRGFSDTGVDELYWDVNGEEWRQPFGRVEARLMLDADLAASLTGDAACYQGSTGSTDRCEIEVTPDAAGAVVTARADALAPRQTMTIAVAFAPGTFAEFDSSPFASPIGWLQGGATLVSVLAVIWAVVVRRRWLRDEPGRPTVIAEYDPPPGLDALESAVLWGAQTKGIPAEVLEQAIAGSIRIVERARRWGSQTFELELIDRSLADENGRELLDGMFPDGKTAFTLGKSDARVSRTAQKILKEADATLTAMGVRRVVPAIVRARPILVGILAAVAAVILGVIGLSGGITPAWSLTLMFVAPVLAVVAGVLVSRKPLTSRGAELRDHLAGVKVFIGWAEADRIRMLQSPRGAERAPISVDDPRQMVWLYERLLPYAVVFGQEKEWAERIVVYYGDSQPSWYYGTSAFSAAAFSSSISSLSASTSTASSSGGSSGGGSAGGGGGGGGGGGV